MKNLIQTKFFEKELIVSTIQRKYVTMEGESFAEETIIFNFSGKTISVENDHFSACKNVVEGKFDEN